MAKGTAFKLENLRLLDFGKIGAAFNAETERVVKDCTDRPADEASRTVSIKFSFTPALDKTGTCVDCDKVKVECEIQSTVPKRRTRIYEMTPHQDGQLSFNPDLPEEPEDQTLYHADEKRDRHK